MNMGIFVLGTGRGVITPKLGTKLYGYPQERPAESVHDDLLVKAAAFGYGKPSALLVEIDLCSIQDYQAEEVSKIIEKETGIPNDNIIFSATHTHSGPCITGAPGWGDNDSEYIEKIMFPNIVEAAKDATKSVVPVKMGIATGESKVGINRRQQLSKPMYNICGRVRLGQCEYGTYDPEMTVISFRNEEDIPVLNIVHYGCHGTASGPGLEITRDWSGVMCDRLEERSGAMTMFINGAIGDVGPRLSNGGTTGDINFMEEIGALGALDATRIYRKIKEFTDVEFKVHTGTLKLPYKKIENAEAIKAEIELYKGFTQGMEHLMHETLKERLRILESGEEQKTELNLKQVLFSFNSVVLVPFKFEVFSEITLRLREYSPMQYTLGMSNVNGSYAYLPCEGQIPCGGYEVLQFLYRYPYALVNDTDFHIINENLRLINELKNK